MTHRPLSGPPQSPVAKEPPTLVTRRDAFAAAALQAILIRGFAGNIETVAEDAYKIADAMERWRLMGAR